MRRLLVIAWAILMLWACAALAEESALSIDAPREEIRPGRPVVLSFTVPEDGTCSIDLHDEAGTSVLSIAEGRAVRAGYNSMYWNGTCEGIPVAEGTWILTIWMNGASAETGIQIGPMIPCLIWRSRWNRQTESAPPERATVMRSAGWNMCCSRIYVRISGTKEHTSFAAAYTKSGTDS